MLESLFQFLFEYRPTVFRQGDFRFAPPAGAPVAAAVVIAAVAIAFLAGIAVFLISTQYVRPMIILGQRGETLPDSARGRRRS